MKITFSLYDYQARFDMTKEEINAFRRYVYTYCTKHNIDYQQTNEPHTNSEEEQQFLDKRLEEFYRM